MLILSSEMEKRLGEVLIRSVGDMRVCPHCGHSCVFNDRTAQETWKFYEELFITNNTQTHLFDEWNW